MLAPQQILQSLQPATAVSHGKRALSQWDFSPWRSQLSLRRYSFSGVFEERPPRSPIVGNIRNSTFRERWKDADHEPSDRAALDAQSSGGTPLVRLLMIGADRPLGPEPMTVAVSDGGSLRLPGADHLELLLPYG